MELESSLLCLQEHIAGHTTESDESSPHPPIYFFNIRFNIIFPSTNKNFTWITNECSTGVDSCATGGNRQSKTL
jgi:hypothetical protein